MQEDPFDPRTWSFDHQFQMYAGKDAEVACLVDEEDYLFFTQWLWGWQRNKKKLYFRRALTYRNQGERSSGSIYLHIEIMKRVESPPSNILIVDHKNGNSLDNRRDNLRWATRHENARNINGVYVKQGGLWWAKQTERAAI